MVALYKSSDHENANFSLAQGTHELLELLEEIDEYLDEQLQVELESSSHSVHYPAIF